MRAEKHLGKCTEPCRFNTNNKCCCGLRRFGCYNDEDGKVKKAIDDFDNKHKAVDEVESIVLKKPSKKPKKQTTQPSKVTAQLVRGKMLKVNALAIKYSREKHLLDKLCEIYYGPESYSDHDLDSIIDCLDYGQGDLKWKDFDSEMKRINEGSK